MRSGESTEGLTSTLLSTRLWHHLNKHKREPKYEDQGQDVQDKAQLNKQTGGSGWGTLVMSSQSLWGFLHTESRVSMKSVAHLWVILTLPDA